MAVPEPDEVGDALGALAQHVVGHAEGLEHGGLLLGEVEQTVIGDDDQGVDVLGEVLDAGGGGLGALAALEGEGLGDDAHGQGAYVVLGNVSDDGSGAGTGATTLACGDEDHVGAGKGTLNLVTAVLSGLGSNLGVGACTQAFGDVGADVHLDVGVRDCERLGIGVDGDKLDAADALLDHAVDGIGAAAAHTYDLDDGEVVAGDVVVVHVSSLWGLAPAVLPPPFRS